MIKLIRLVLLAAVVLGATVLMALPKSAASGETSQPETNATNSASAAGSATTPGPSAGSAGSPSRPSGTTPSGGAPATGNRPAGGTTPSAEPVNTAPILPGSGNSDGVTQPAPREVPGTTILPPAPTPEPAVRTVWPKTHVIRSGETFQKIAKRYYGGFSKWRRIADANPGVDPSRIRPGQKLTIPAPPRGR